MIRGITRSWPGQPSSLVDHIWTNSADNLISTSNLVYRSKIQNIDWTDYYRCDEINKLNEICVEKVGRILEEEAPLKNGKIKKTTKIGRQMT